MLLKDSLSDCFVSAHGFTRPFFLSSRGDEPVPAKRCFLRFVVCLSRRGICFFNFFISLYDRAFENENSVSSVSPW